MADDVPEPDPEKAQAMSRGALSGGISAKDGWDNLMTGLGFRKKKIEPSGEATPVSEKDSYK